MTVRDAVIYDAEGILEIYAYYTENTVISWETEPPSLEEFTGRMQKIMARYPYLVLEEDGVLLGYAYAGPFVGRAAYDWSCELTIYLRHERLKDMGILNLYACIGVPEGEEDEYLTNNSADFHAHLGFTEVGRFRNCGSKFGRWYTMIWMEKIIGEHTENIEPVQSYKH